MFPERTEEFERKRIKALRRAMKNPRTRQKISLSQQGENNSFYGKTHTKEARKKIGKSSRERKTWKKWGKDTRVKNGQNEGEHPAWKGDDVGYSAVHTWVRKHKSKPSLCVRCGKEKPTLLHNIDGEYKRNIEDYQWLCNRCHLIIHGLIGEN